MQLSKSMTQLGGWALLAGCMTVSGVCAEPLAVESAQSQYKLNLEKSAALWLATARADVAPAPEPKPSSASLRLAAMPFAKLIEGAAREMELDPALVHAVIAVESGYNATARSPKGALGLMQVMPATALRYGIRNAARSPVANLRAGTRYLSELMQLFDHKLELVLAAYNAGENAVIRYGQRIPPYRETREYVPAVLTRYNEWREPVPIVDPVAVAPARVRIQYMPGTSLDLDFVRAAGHR